MPSKRRRNQPPAPAPARAAAQPRKRGGWVWWAAGAGLLAIVGLVIAAAIAQSSRGAGAQPSAQLRQPGPVANCRSVPRFATAAGYTTVNFATDDRSVMGLQMVDPANPQRVFQDPSWTMGGYLGPVIADGQGNVYVAPVPRINLIDNPPELQNRIYKVDSNTGKMALFVELPAPAARSPENPYGALGLAIDCETNSLYVTSVAGSTRTIEQGGIYRIDLASGAVVSRYEGVDAIGVGVFVTAGGKRLYFGPARVSEVRSVALDDAGNFAGGERVEFALTAPGASGNDRARRISFTDAGEMLVNGRQFDFNLVANTYQPILLYVYRYRGSDDGWNFVQFSADG